jgi:hypothetical protein
LLQEVIWSNGKSFEIHTPDDSVCAKLTSLECSILREEGYFVRRQHRHCMRQCNACKEEERQDENSPYLQPYIVSLC